MNISDETLMAYVDNTVDGETRAAIEGALAGDAALAARLAAHRQLVARVQGAYAPVMQESVPAHLVALAQRFGDAPGAKVLDFAASREARARRHEAKRSHSIMPWFGAMAASVLVGVMIGRVLVAGDAGPVSTASMVEVRGGSLAAGGALAEALSGQLAQNQKSDAVVRIALSFRNKDGETCRAFKVASAGDMAGIACRAGNDWRLRVMTEDRHEAGTVYRQASSALSPLLLQKVDEMIAGESLDAAAESAAAAKGWR
jgi:anti-sigma factor RsiW